MSVRLKQLAYPVTIGVQVAWYPRAERWRIDVVEPSTMIAIYITHGALTQIIGTNSLDPCIIAGSVQVHRTAIEELISDAETENWPDRLGVLPHGKDGFYSR